MAAQFGVSSELDITYGETSARVVHSLRDAIS
jgi:hypothetical protein